MKYFYLVWGAITLLVVYLLITSIPHNVPFFGAVVDGDYIYHFDGKMRCAYIVGWHDERKCMCFLTEKDPSLGNDKSLIASMPNACDSQFKGEPQPD